MQGCNQFVRCPRDERGWLIPRVGTVTRQIYDLLVQGKTRSEIVQAFPTLKESPLDARIWRIKNPDLANERRNAANRSRRKLPARSSTSPTSTCAGISPEAEAYLRGHIAAFLRVGEAVKAAEVEKDLAFLKYFALKWGYYLAPPRL